MPYVVLENVTQGKKFKAKNNPTISYTKDNSVTQLPIPELPEEATNLIKVFGVVGKLAINFDLVPDTEDLSMGTHATPIQSVWQQIDYLSAYFVTEKIGESHKVVVADGTTTYLTRNGVFTRLSIDFRAGEGERARALIEFLVGQVM